MQGAGGIIYPLVRPLLFALDPERAHRCALTALRIRGHLGSARQSCAEPVELMGLRFPNRVGLAAGFDKDGEAVDGIGRLGFGFIEVGTLTPRPQQGQSRPRLFRLPAAHALINRLGFPNEGAEACAQRLRSRRFAGIVGVNIGKNADTPLESATHDYVAALRAVHDTADYVAVNISSPNTAALRELHARERLVPLLKTLLQERNRLRESLPRSLPLLLKISPDLDRALLSDVASAVLELGMDGVIATNTTVQRPEITSNDLREGGLSGRPLHPLALETVASLRRALGPGFPLVGVGGIESAEAARAMRAAGADLVQIYTGLIYRGPRLVRDCVDAIG